MFSFATLFPKIIGQGSGGGTVALQNRHYEKLIQFGFKHRWRLDLYSIHTLHIDSMDLSIEDLDLYSIYPDRLAAAHYEWFISLIGQSGFILKNLNLGIL